MIKEKHMNYLPFKHFWQLEEAFEKIKTARIQQQKRHADVYVEFGVPHEYGQYGGLVGYLMDVTPETKDELTKRQKFIHENDNIVKNVFDELGVEVREI